jgi:hypothetical protein
VTTEQPPGPIEAHVRDLLGVDDNHTPGPLEQAVLLLAAELDRRPGSKRVIDPADAAHIGRPA